MKKHLKPVGVILFGLMAIVLIVTARTRLIDYDEFLHVHSLWLVAQGKIPYTDFLAVHPPYFWYLYKPLFTLLPKTFEIILTLRMVNLGFSLLSLLFLWCLSYRFINGKNSALAAGAAMLVIFFQPGVVESLVEFRMDQIATAILLGALLLYEQESRQTPVWIFLSGVLIAMALVMNTKLILIPALVIGIELAPLLRRQNINAKKIALAFGGLLVGLSGMGAFLLLQRINLSEAFRCVYVYHSLVAQEFGREASLAELMLQINQAQFYLPCLLLVVGIAALIVCGRRAGAAKIKYALAFALFGVIQTLIVPFPFKHYASTVFLLWAVPLALAFDCMLFWNTRRSAKGFVLMLTVAATALGVGRLVQEKRASMIETQRSMSALMLNLVPPNTSLIGIMTLHPLFRDDAAFVFFSTLTPKDPKLVKIFHRMSPQDARFTYDGLLQQIRANKPSLVIQTDIFQDPPLFAAVGTYLREESANYALMQSDEHSRIFKRKLISGQ